MKIDYKKSLKFLTLLVTAILISAASAAIYDYMYMNANIGVQKLGLEWISGDDATDAGTQINGVTTALTTLRGPPNGTRVYADPVRLNNTGAGDATFNLTINAISGDTTQLDSIYVRIYSFNTSQWINNLTVWESGAAGSNLNDLTIPADNLWRFQWEIKWASTATAADDALVNLRLEVPV